MSKNDPGMQQDPRPTVSVIIPTHNRLTQLPLAIESVLAQHYPIHELWVVDDGSNDGTANWLRSTYPQIKLISQTNHGVSHARNRAIEQATGEWIALLDSDDRWFPEKLTMQMEAIRLQPSMRLCHCDEHWFRAGKRVNPKHKHQKKGGHIYEHCLPLCAISPSAVLLARTLLDDVGLFDESLPACEDYDLWLRITCREPVLYIDRPLLEKTGGHEDQLSQRHPAMDQFRLRALAKQLRSNNLTDGQTLATQNMFNSKLTIYCNGAKKRGRHNAVEELLREYSDIIDSDTIL